MADARQDDRENQDKQKDLPFPDKGIRSYDIKIARPEIKVDFATIIGLTVAFGLIIAAIILSEGRANFINPQALLIVFFGTIAVTSISYSGEELAQTGKIIAQTLVRERRDPGNIVIQILDMGMLARQKGLLALSELEEELNDDPYLKKAVLMAVDGFTGRDIDNILGQELEAQFERHKRSAGIVKRASEIAPAMGLIGTLLGLVQMLARLDDPASIGPAMAIALLTTFYGAILGTVILAPLAAKLERNAHDEMVAKRIIILGMQGIVNQDNPRRLEMVLNSELPPIERVEYFR